MKQSRGGGDPEQAAELDRQYKAMEQSLRAYVDQRLAARGETTRPAPRRDLLGLVPVAIVALAALGLAAWPLFRKPVEPAPLQNIEAPVTPNEPETREPESPAPPPANPIRAAVASGEADGQWAVSLKNVMEQHGAIAAAAMRAPNDATLDAFARRVEAGQRLTQAERAKARMLLLEAIAGAKGRALTPEVISRLRATYSVTTRSTDKTNADLQSEIILRWMEAQAR